MSLRQAVMMALADKGHIVVPWGNATSQDAVIVRPGGIVSEREVVEVWIVNAYRADPDEGLAERGNAIFNELRTMLLDITVTPGPTYDPVGAVPHSTLILTGAGRARGLG